MVVGKLYSRGDQIYQRAFTVARIGYSGTLSECSSNLRQKTKSGVVECPTKIADSIQCGGIAKSDEKERYKEAKKPIGGENEGRKL